MLENYIKTIHIEALTMIDMVNKDVLPAIEGYLSELSDSLVKRSAVIPGAVGGFEKARIQELDSYERSIYEKVTSLENALLTSEKEDSLATAVYHRQVIFATMQSLRADVDNAERITSAKYWPYPSYGELLFGVR